MDNHRKYKKNDVGVLVVETGVIYKSRRECAQALTASPQLVSNCLSGYCETCKGYHLKLVDVSYDPNLTLDALNDVESQKTFGSTWAAHPRLTDVLLSDDGRAVTCRGGKWENATISPGGRGYRTIYAHGKNRPLHILIAETFVPNPDNKPWVNHLDGDKTNNRASNLVWSTPSENEYHAYRTGLKYAHHKGRKIRIVETGCTYPSIKACADELHTYGPSISRCLSGERDTHRGLHFEYVDGEEFSNAY